MCDAPLSRLLGQRGIAHLQNGIASVCKSKDGMNELNLLGRTEVLADRAFTHPDYSFQDLNMLHFALDQLRALLNNPALAASLAGGQQLFWVEVDGRLHRLIVADCAGLQSTNTLTLVGFFGQRRPHGDHELIDQVDTELVAELVAHPGLLAYCSILLAEGNYGNLVLFSDEAAKLHWSTSTRHAYAAHVLSPKYYESVRLHNGILPGGLFSGQAPVLERTKYYDYRGMLPWRAERIFV
jgi:hypothetical protein